MASVTFPEALGGNGQTYTDDADPDTGLDGLGYTTRFIPCLQQAVVMGLSAQSNAQACADYVQQCQTLREAVGNDRLAVAADRQHVDQQRQAVDTAAASAAQSAASVNADNIVHAPGSGLPNAAGKAYSRDVVGGAGDLMALGAFGAGVVLDATDISDFDMLPPGRALTAQTGLTNSPLSAGRFLVITDIRSALYSQIAIHRDTGKFYYRGAASLSQAKALGWSSILSNSSMIGQVSQSGGVPTGAIFESDSNTFGSWVKFASGEIMFQSAITGVDINIAVAPGSNFRHSGPVRWMLPQPVYGHVSAFGRIINDEKGMSVNIPEGAPPLSTTTATTELNKIYAYIRGNNEIQGRTLVLSGWARWY